MTKEIMPFVGRNTSARQRGWCPRCTLHSVVVTPSSLVCSSPQCEWEEARSEALEKEVFGGPAQLTSDRLAQLQRQFGFSG
jgi:hypothetical protein